MFENRLRKLRTTQRRVAGSARQPAARTCGPGTRATRARMRPERNAARAGPNPRAARCHRLLPPRGLLAARPRLKPGVPGDGHAWRPGQHAGPEGLRTPRRAFPTAAARAFLVPTSLKIFLLRARWSGPALRIPWVVSDPETRESERRGLLPARLLTPQPGLVGLATSDEDQRGRGPRGPIAGATRRARPLGMPAGTSGWVWAREAAWCGLCVLPSNCPSPPSPRGTPETADVCSVASGGAGCACSGPICPFRRAERRPVW